MRLNLSQFINRSQLQCLRDLTKGEEGAYFVGLITELKKTIANMPATYDTDGKGDTAPVSLHYFTSSSDWYIIERDCEYDQQQAYGFVCLNGDFECAESGYVSIEELLQHGAELDLYWNIRTLEDVKNEYRFDKAA